MGTSTFAPATMCVELQLQLIEDTKSRVGLRTFKNMSLSGALANMAVLILFCIHGARIPDS